MNNYAISSDYVTVQRHEIDKWDLRELRLAKFIAEQRSKDPSTKTGAVITNGRIEVSLGYNGFPQRMQDRPEWYNNRDEKYSRIVHCEINAMIFATQNPRSYPLSRFTLYTWPFASCDRCCVQMIQWGIARFVFPTPTEDALSRWKDSFDRTKAYITECGLLWTEIPRDEVLADTYNETIPEVSGTRTNT